MEGVILRKYNYNLETGTVGTDNEKIAGILYNINRMEMKVSYKTFDIQELDKALGELYFMISDSRSKLNNFLEDFGDKINADTVNTVNTAFDDAMKNADEAIQLSCLDQPDMTKICLVFPEVYRKLLAIVPSILALDDQAVGRV
ncbi:MAG: hypothetical protein LBU66_07930 [Treponema sp.]|jgi:uncharacterized coiled-coil protein SlyX|nr:hypothetical protein [Treponema sp.]